jgi:flagellar M-ring protein FliF
VFQTSVLKALQAPALRLRIALVAGAVALTLGAVAFFAARDAQTPLFSRPLRGDQLVDVETQLAGWSVPFKAAPDNVLVPVKRRNDLLLRLSLAGVPRPHIEDSSETLAKIGALTPQSVLDAQTRDGLAGDLALGLRGITGIADAHVIIAPATPGYFADESSHEASASVRVALDPGVTLSPETVNGIKTFVASGVPGLDAGHVAVLDDRGIALSGRPASGEGEARQLQESIQTALDAVVGAGRAIVRAHVDLSRQSSVRLETKRTPTLTKPLASTNFSERYVNGQKHYVKTQSAADTGSDIVQNETHDEPGDTQRVSIAVFLDERLAGQIPRIRALVETAGGIEYARGDTVTVQPLAMAASPADAVAVPAAAFSPPAPPASVRALLAAYLPALPPLVITLAWLGLALLLAKPIADAVRSFVPPPAPAPPPVPVVSADAAPEAIHRMLCGEPAYAAATVIAGLPTATAAAVLDLYPSDTRRDIIAKLARPRSPLAVDVAESLRA